MDAPPLARPMWCSGMVRSVLAGGCGTGQVRPTRVRKARLSSACPSSQVRPRELRGPGLGRRRRRCTVWPSLRSKCDGDVMPRCASQLRRSAAVMPPSLSTPRAYPVRSRLSDAVSSPINSKMIDSYCLPIWKYYHVFMVANTNHAPPIAVSSGGRP